MRVVLAVVAMGWLGGQAFGHGQEAVRFLTASYDAEKGVGSLLALGEEKVAFPLQQRPGEFVQEIHRLKMGPTRGVLALWRDVATGKTTSPELWVEEDAGPEDQAPAACIGGGELHLVWGGKPRIDWVDARIKVRPTADGAQLVVERALVGENAIEPRMRVKELYAVHHDGVLLAKSKEPAPASVEQALNLFDLYLGRGDKAAAAKVYAKLPAKYRERAGVVATRAAGEGEAREAARNMLDVLAVKGGATGLAAANRQLAMDWEETP